MSFAQNAHSHFNTIKLRTARNAAVLSRFIEPNGNIKIDSIVQIHQMVCNSRLSWIGFPPDRLFSCVSRYYSNSIISRVVFSLANITRVIRSRAKSLHARANRRVAIVSFARLEYCGYRILWTALARRSLLDITYLRSYSILSNISQRAFLTDYIWLYLFQIRDNKYFW